MEGARRFWKTVAVAETGDGFTVFLDDKPIRSPLKSDFAMPTRALAEAVAEEWRGQGEIIDPGTMPQTRYVNSGIDGVPSQRSKIIDAVTAYGGTDLLCYRAPYPDALIDRQSAAWDPLLTWVRDRYQAPLVQVEGVMRKPQPETSLTRLREAVTAHDDFALAALHDLVAISGSLVLGLAVSDRRLEASEAFGLSRLDEDWQTEQWGVDAEAAEAAARKAQDFGEAARFLHLLRQTARMEAP